MRFAFCLFRFFPFSGLAIDMLRIADCAHRRGHEVHILTSEWQSAPSGKHQMDIIPVSGLTNHGRAVSFHRAVRPRLRKEFDAVVGFNKMPGLDVYYAADPCFAARARYSRHPLYRLTPRFRSYRQLEHAVFSRDAGTQILVLSDYARSEYQEFYGTQDARFTVLPPTIREEFRDISPTAGGCNRIRTETGVKANDLIVLMVGSGFRTKGVDRAITAVAAQAPDLLRRTHLLIAGEGTPDAYIALARARGVLSRVTFLGGRLDVPDLMAASNVLLHSAYNENTGAVLLEAMAMGLPILTTDVCGYAPYVTEADAGRVLHSPFDQSSLNHELGVMLRADPATWRHNGPAYTHQPLFYAMPDTAVDIIEQVADRSRRRVEGNRHFFYLSDKVQLGATEADFDSVLSLQGQIFRKAPGRRTVRFVRRDTGYFLKAHSGVGWGEIIKNLASLKRPVLGAGNEWHALHLLGRKGIRTPAPLGFGTRGRNPARRQSFVIMEEIADSSSLEQLFPQGGHVYDVPLKRQLITQLAGIARTLHSNGVNHRDFYLCHFLINNGNACTASETRHETGDIALIDLHRAQIRRSTPMRWIVKDLGSLYYSAMHINLSRNDLFRFIRTYCGQPLRAALTGPVNWNRVQRRALRLYRSERTSES